MVYAVPDARSLLRELEWVAAAQRTLQSEDNHRPPSTAANLTPPAAVAAVVEDDLADAHV